MEEKPDLPPDLPLITDDIRQDIADVAERADPQRASTQFIRRVNETIGAQRRMATVLCGLEPLLLKQPPESDLRFPERVAALVPKAQGRITKSKMTCPPAAVVAEAARHVAEANGQPGSEFAIRVLHAVALLNHAEYGLQVATACAAIVAASRRPANDGDRAAIESFLEAARGGR